MSNYLINLLKYEDNEAIPFDTVKCLTFEDLVKKAKDKLFPAHRIGTHSKKSINETIEFYSVEADCFLNADVYDDWLNTILPTKVQEKKCEVYCQRHGDPHWKKIKQPDCSLHELLGTPLLKTIEEDVSKSMTQPVLDPPANFLFWKDFDSLFARIKTHVESKRTKYAKYVQTYDPVISSHDSLLKLISITGDAVFAERVFKDTISKFDSRPNQSKETIAKSGGKLPNDGDLFYRASSTGSNSTSSKIIHLMEVKTRTSLPIDSYKEEYKDKKDQYDRLLCDIFHGEVKVTGLSQLRIENLASQMKMMMRSDSNSGIKHVYTLLSTFEATFVLFYDNEEIDSLWISRPLPREELLLAMYLVLSIQLHQRHLLKKASQDLLDILMDLDSEHFPTPPSQSDSSNNSSLSQNNTTMTDGVKYSSLNAQSLSSIWKRGPKEMIASGRTCFVTKVSYNHRWIALKMVYLYRNEKGSLEELENEKDVMQWINLNTKLSIVPIVHYYGNISLYRTLAMDYVDGECFRDFSEMSLPMIEACDKSVLDLHKCRVLHGDLEPWNFILARVKNNYKAHIIDFGRARCHADDPDLNTEYARFCDAANINDKRNNSLTNRSI